MRRRSLRLGEDYDEILAGADPKRRVAQSRSTARDIARMDQPFEPGARQRREMEGKRAIKALPGLTGTGEDGGRSAANRVGLSRQDPAFLLHRSKADFPG